MRHWIHVKFIVDGIDFEATFTQSANVCSSVYVFKAFKMPLEFTIHFDLMNMRKQIDFNHAFGQKKEFDIL